LVTLIRGIEALFFHDLLLSAIPGYLMVLEVPEAPDAKGHPAVFGPDD